MNTHAQSFRFVAGFYTAILTLAFLLPTQAFAEVGIAWVEPTRGVFIALDAADNVYTVDYEQALGAEMSLTKRDASGGLLGSRPLIRHRQRPGREQVGSQPTTPATRSSAAR